MNACVMLTCSLLAFNVEPRASVVVVVGDEGAAEFAPQFRQWTGRWEEAAKRGNANFVQIGLDELGQTSDRERLEQSLAENATPGPEALWLILIGHGTFDGKTARFNLRGPDVSAAELANWLKPYSRPLAIINCASSSGPFVNELSGPNRVVVTATKSGFEYNFARFGDYLSAAMTNPAADLDKDEQTSLLEAFLLASSGVREFYASEGRLVTEHALVDDNGDHQGTPPDWFQGVRAVKTPKDGASADGLLAGQMHLVRSRSEEQLSAAVRARRDEIEQDLVRLRSRRSQVAEDEYLKLLEPLFVELARLYEAAASGAERIPGKAP